MPPATTTIWPVTWPRARPSSAPPPGGRRPRASRSCEGHRSGDAVDHLRIVDLGAGHRRLRPPRADAVDLPRRGDPHDLVLQAQQEPVGDRRLRRRIVGVARLAEDAGCRADEHQVLGRFARPIEGTSRREECRGQVLAQRLLPALERQRPNGRVLRGPDPGDRGADVQLAGLLEQPLGLVLPGWVRSAWTSLTSPSASARSRPRW